MIVALILVDSGTLIDARPAALLESDGRTLIEIVTATVLRGPFGGTIVASPPAFSADVHTALHGFAVQHVDAPNKGGTHEPIIHALKAAANFRQRWEKIRAAAATRFQDADDEDEEKPKPAPHKSGAAAKAKADAKAQWGKHKQNPDVKVRGLARSFDRDGVALFRAEHPLVSLELQAQMVEAFAREAATKDDEARPFAQALYEGRRGYPILMSTDGAREVEGLAAATNFDDWLLENLRRVQDVAVQEAGAVEAVRSRADLDALRPKLLKRRA
ncbi:MAG TPA: hypothetical protein VEJ63_00260 [Planctomycetota bacterium]|nr:hypothetical protein [Planctomycetota bacterium]